LVMRVIVRIVIKRKTAFGEKRLRHVPKDMDSGCASMH
jgi:hypothetical protein